MTYLSLKPQGRFVRGPRRSALYDLGIKRIYPLDEWTSRLVADSLAGRPLERVLQEMGVRGAGARRLVTQALSKHPLLVATLKPTGGSGRGGWRSLAPTSPPAAATPVTAATGASTPPMKRLPMAPASAPITRRRLEFLWLELTERCNLRCVHCYAGSGPGLEDGPMRTGDHLRVLREAAAAGCRQVQFNGGEALLDPDLPALVDEARALGYELIEVYSNATLLNAERVRFLRARGVRVAVSFYSHREEVHEAITQVPGSFRRTLEAIRALVQSGVPVRAGLIRMRLNQDDVEAAKDLLASLGVGREKIAVDDVRPAGRGCGDSLVPGDGRVQLTSPPTGHAIELEVDGEPGCRTCWSGRIAVAPSGEVFPCIFSRELPAGNVLRTPLPTVIEGSALQDLWSIDKAQIPVCRDCEFRYGCFDCRALAYKQTGQLRSKPPSCKYDPYNGTWENPAADASLPLPEEAAVPVRAADLRWETTGEVGLLYSRARQVLVAVNRVAAEILGKMDGRRSLRRIARDLARRYGTSEPAVRRDVRALVRELAGLGLVELRAA
jgi:radical SAM protein with 4Fe4S-binding SPASM domain